MLTDRRETIIQCTKHDLILNVRQFVWKRKNYKVKKSAEHRGNEKVRGSEWRHFADLEHFLLAPILTSFKIMT